MTKTGKANKPDPYLTIKLDDEGRELFMSFGLLDELTRIIEDPSRVGSIYLDEELREKVLTSALAVRKKSGKIEEAVEDFDDLDISIDDVERILDWVSDHTMGFFIRSLQKVVGVSERHKDQMEGLESSLGGLKASTSAEASSGQPA